MIMKIEVKKILVCLFVLFSVAMSARDIPIVPKPQKTELKDGFFEINSDTRITFNEKDDDGLTGFLSDFLLENYRLKLRTDYSSKVKKNAVNFVSDPSFSDEVYHLAIDGNSVTIKGNRTGLFYGLQSLLQLMPFEKSAVVQLPRVTIQDSPRFNYRGAMLDVGRYFYTVEDVKRFIDLMAYYKLNTFHWHLTEDAGWRIEIEKYPLLTKIGAWRRGTQSNHAVESFDRLPHGGYYTKKQMSDVVAYAQKRNITIIPEIDMPGHTLSVLAAYPEYSCTGGPFKVLESWGIQEDVLCAGKEETYEFIEDVLDELLDIFPSEVIHIGGDEAPKNRWKACPHCQAKIKQENLKDEDELQSYFVKRVGTYLQGKGRKMMGWDEILEGGLAPNAMVMSWRGEEGGIEAARMGHEVVMAPNVFMYLDYYQGLPEEEPLNIWGDVPLRRVYDYEPHSPRVPAENHKYIVGLQGNLWMEYIHSLPKLDYMAFPRLAAVAEVGWSDSDKNFDDFQSRLAANLRWLDKKGVNFRIPDPIGLRSIETSEHEAEVRLSPPIMNSEVYYTLDGSDPLQYGTRYESPFKVGLSENDSVILQSVVRTETGRVSGTRKAVISRTQTEN